MSILKAIHIHKYNQYLENIFDFKKWWKYINWSEAGRTLGALKSVGVNKTLTSLHQGNYVPCHTQHRVWLDHVIRLANKSKVVYAIKSGRSHLLFMIFLPLCQYSHHGFHYFHSILFTEWHVNLLFSLYTHEEKVSKQIIAKTKNYKR